MSDPNTAAAYFRRLHAKLVEYPLSDRDDAWFSQLAMLGEDVLGGLTLFQAQERLTMLVRLANPANDD